MSQKTKYFQNCLGVFQGGGCKGSAYVGAYLEAMKRGVSFSGLVGTSAGSITAAFIGAGASPEKLETIMRQMNFKDFLGKPTKLVDYTPPSNNSLMRLIPNKTLRGLRPIVKNLGKYNSAFLRHWMDEELKKLLSTDKNESIKFRDLYIPTHIVATNIVTKTVEIYSSERTPDMAVADAVQRSCNIPFFFQPIEMKYIDGGLLSNLPSFVFYESKNKLYSKILAFSLHGTFESDNKIQTFEDYAKAVVETTLDGGLELQLKLQEDIHVINIDTGTVRATDFEKINEDTINYLVGQGKNATSEFFENEIGLVRSRKRGKQIAANSFQTNNQLVQTIDQRYKEIIICDKNTDWLYELFPTLLKWLSGGAKISVILQENSDNRTHGPYRLRLLHRLGIQVQNCVDIPFRIFLFDGSDPDKCKAIILNSNYNDNSVFHSQLYEGEFDFEAIFLFREKLMSIIDLRKSSHEAIKIEKGDEASLIELIKTVKQYNKESVQCRFTPIKVKDITLLTKYVRGYKYRQIEALFELYSKFGIHHFKSAKLLLNDKMFTYFTPPIVEKIGNYYFLLEGNTRVTYAYRNGIEEIYCILIEGVTDPLPSSGRFKVHEILLTDTPKVGDERYNDFERGLFRHIERAVRPPETCLT